MKQWFTFDHILELQTGKRARAICSIPSTLALFETHFPRFPVLPGVLILDCLADLALCLLREQTAQLWRVQQIEQARFRHFVQPGDQMQLAVELKTVEGMHAHLSGKALVQGQCMADVRHICLEGCS